MSFTAPSGPANPMPAGTITLVELKSLMSAAPRSGVYFKFAEIGGLPELRTFLEDGREVSHLTRGVTIDAGALGIVAHVVFDDTYSGPSSVSSVYVTDLEVVVPSVASVLFTAYKDVSDPKCRVPKPTARACDECSGTGQYESPLTGKKSPCSKCRPLATGGVVQP